MRVVRLLRNVLEVDQVALAARAGISVRTLARIESGEYQPTLEVLQAVDRAFEGIVQERAEKETP